jgi:hypothetical protein
MDKDMDIKDGNANITLHTRPNPAVAKMLSLTDDAG